MANLASGISRIVLNITSSTPSVEWPNYGSVMHNAYLGRIPGYGTELGSAARVVNPHRGTDIRPAGGVKQNIASFTFNRYSKKFTVHEEKKWVEGSGGSGQGAGHGGGGGWIYNTSYTFTSDRYAVEHTPDIPSTLVGFAVDLFSLNRASHQHQLYAASYVRVLVRYRTVANPNLQTVDYGHVLTYGVAWGSPHHQVFERALGDGSGFTYFKVEAIVYHGLGNWHDSGDRSPSNWSPDIPICNPAHAVGISSNYWRSINNGSSSSADYATVYYKPNQTQVNLPKKHFTPDKVLAGNGYSQPLQNFWCPWWRSHPPS